MELQGFQAHQAALRLPFFGRLTRCTDRGFAFVDSIHGEFFVHIRDHMGKELSSLEGLDGHPCSFVTGGHPFRYAQAKGGWDGSVVQWFLLDEKITPPEHRELRRSALDSLQFEGLISLLEADWYIGQWKQKAGVQPRTRLRRDLALDRIVEAKLANAKSLNELLLLLAAVTKSPWYTANAEGRKLVFDKFFKPTEWPKRVFESDVPLSAIPGFDEIFSFGGARLSKIAIKARTVAIDIEADKDSIFEVGWENVDGSSLVREKKGISRDALKEAVSESIGRRTRPIIVGHNLLAWDWSRLEEHGAEFPDASERWDTLIAGWILEPWRSSHALVVAENAHRADADARAAHTLFSSQLSEFQSCLGETITDIHKLADRLFENPSRLSRVDSSRYRRDFLSSSEATTLFPAARISELAWQAGCRIYRHSIADLRLDPVLCPKVCREIALDQNTFETKIVSIVVADADANDVEVKLSNLPEWLVDASLRATLRDGHQAHEESAQPKAQHTILIAEDLFLESKDVIARAFTAEGFSVEHGSEVATVWQVARETQLTPQEVEAAYPGLTDTISSRSLMPAEISEEGPGWLIYEPPGIGASKSLWMFVPAIPNWMRPTLLTSGYRIPIPQSVSIPRWRDGALRGLPLDRLFVSPDTPRRTLYLAEITHCVLNLIKNSTDGEFFLIAMRWPEEAERLQASLQSLGFSSSAKKTPLRRLERNLKKGHRAVCCSRENIESYINASKELACSLTLVIDEVPLSQWYAIFNDPDSRGSAANVDRLRQGDASSQGRDTITLKKNVVLSQKDSVALTSNFMAGWIEALVGKDNAKSLPVQILDTRLTGTQFERSGVLSLKDTPFYSLEELLSKDKLDLFQEICFPQAKTADVPKDYESYRAFLEKNWGFADFREGTQRPAIQKVIETEQDILIRLPTGAGKSVIFHLPALLRSSYTGRLTIVITPLRALMRDQVEGLWKKGFIDSVDYLSGGRDPAINTDVYRGVLDGRIRLLFVAPERFRVRRFIDVLERRRALDGGFEFIVFDEAHCISEWGFEFRPDYLFAAKFVREWFIEKKLPGNPHRILLTSATVTDRNRADLQSELGLGKTAPFIELPEDMPHPIQPFIQLTASEADEAEDAPRDEKFDEIIDALEGIDLKASAALVFVSRRKDCHRLSEKLNELAAHSDNPNLTKIHALPFHAGLPESIKAEAADLLRDRVANVLVCTKAFGMGMDIPHIHMCVHFRPPAYIEDYLQEVGRIGRGETERIRTGHEQVVARLLYNESDVERNLNFLHVQAVKPPELEDLFAFCIENSKALGVTGRPLCIVPASVRSDETRSLDEGQVTKALFWLERMGVLQIEGRIQPTLSLEFEVNPLRKAIVDGKSMAAKVGRAIIEVYDESTRVLRDHPSGNSEPPEEIANESTFGRIVRGVLSGILAIVSGTEASRTETHLAAEREPNTARTKQDGVTLDVQVGALMAAAGGLGIDDLYKGLAELCRSKLLALSETLCVGTNSIPSGDDIWHLISNAVDRLSQSTDGNLESFPRKGFAEELRGFYLRDVLGHELIDAKSSDYSEIPRRDVAQAERATYRAINASLMIVRDSGCDIKEMLSETGELLYGRAISAESSSTIRAHAKDAQNKAKKLFDVISSEKGSATGRDETFLVPLSTIFERFGPELRFSELQRLIRLLERTGLYSFESSLGEWGSLVSLETTEPLEAHDPERKEKSRIQQVYSDMLSKSEMQILRAHAMVLLAALPIERKKQYIDRYFQSKNVEELTTLLEDTVGEVDDDTLSGNRMLGELLDRVRQKRFEEEFEELNDNQRAVCQAPYTANLLVNAGPGSGKTHVLMMRCAYLIHRLRLSPSDILVLAFNRAVVFEIRDRIRSLFRALGYGNYANRLDVSTFHSFALRHQVGTDLYEEDAVGDAVHHFAQALASDPENAASIGRRYKAILVDEFQDMNEDFFQVVINLVRRSSGGCMVIGDDDQDILAWNRRKWQKRYGGDAPIDGAKYFEDFKQQIHPIEHELTLNYRSTPEIVERANLMIANVSARIGFQRMKSDVVLEAFRDVKGTIEIPFDPNELFSLAADSLERGEDAAILCRSNDECHQLSRQLTQSPHFEKEQLNLAGSEDFPLYQLRHSGAMMDILRDRRPYEFIDSYTWQGLIQEFGDRQLADSERAKADLDILFDLINAEVGRPRVSDFVAFIQQLRESDVNRLKEKSGLSGHRSKLTISTVHKVKGLQFDTVFLLPSEESFPFGQNSSLQPVDSAEEARLFYVGMTRAKNTLYAGWGSREKHWMNGAKYSAKAKSKTALLGGSPEEVFVSWAGYSDQVTKGLQNYIETNVSIGDAIEIRGKRLFHDGQHVGSLANKTANKLSNAARNESTRVGNVIRYTCGPYFKEHKPEYWKNLAEHSKQRGWFYVVLPTQRFVG